MKIGLDDALTNDEIDGLRRAGWLIGGGGLYSGAVKVAGVRNGVRELRTRAEWRAALAQFDVDAEPSPLAVAQAEIARLKEWIRSEGERTYVCTFDILGGEVCSTCRCGRRS